MRKTEMLWFEDVSALNEPVLSFPVFGRISMKQFFILGMTGMISYALFSGTHGLVSAIPICFGAFLTLVKPRVGSSEEMIVSGILFFIGRRNMKKTEHRTKKPKSKRLVVSSSKKLGLSDPFITEVPENKIRTIVSSDLSRPFRFKIKLVGTTGQALANIKSKVYLDDICTDLLTTDINGELETIIVPKIPGQKKITVYVDEQKEPVFSEVIEVRTPQENLA
ncbi:MAG: hypothetical protein KGI27_12380 [Thaumarchaeota archaeon]|nr:hypothetical protein [Nitrososphaerota archaeon]